MSPVQHVMLALGLTLVLFVIAGDSWDSRVASVKPVKPAARRA